MIESIHIRNYKSIKDLWISLKERNILIGSNGAGKSNFVNFFSFVQAIVQKELADYVGKRGGASRFLHLWGSYDDPLRSDLLIGELRFADNNRYSFSLTSTYTDTFYLKTETYGPFKGDLTNINEPFLLNYQDGLRTEAGIGEHQSEFANIIRQNLDSFRVYHFHDVSTNAPLKQTARVADTRFLRADGSNLAAFLYELKQNHVRSFNQIEATVKLIAPYFDRFDLQPNGDYIRLNWRQKGSDMYLDASDLSDGTIRFIALVTLLLQPNLPPTILIDEPELGLHPSAINILSGLVQSVSEKSQVILSTQSVNLVDQFNPEDIIIVENRGNESIFRRLDKTELNEWLQEYTLGEIWNKNIIGGNP